MNHSFSSNSSRFGNYIMLLLHFIPQNNQNRKKNEEIIAAEGHSETPVIISLLFLMERYY